MKRILTIGMMACCAMIARAQEVVDFTAEGLLRDTARLEVRPVAVGSMADDAAPMDFAPSLPLLTSRGTLATYPYYGSLLSGSSYWALHPGLNASVSAAAIFGAGRYGGSGFSNSLAVMYADTITSRLSFALGGYYTTLDWNGHRTNDAGLSAMLSYRFDEHWEATIFAQKSLMQPRQPMPMYWMDDVGDRIGASLHYHFNPAFSIGVSVWSQQQPVPFAGYGPPPRR